MIELIGLAIAIVLWILLSGFWGLPDPRNVIEQPYWRPGDDGT